MTRRSLALGIASVAFLCSIVYFNDYVIDQNYFIGNHFPVSIYGGLILFLLLVNPVLQRMRRTLVFTGGELAVILALTLAACAIPSSNFLRNFAPSLMMPHHHERTKPGWSENDILSLAPSFMLADPGENDEALTGFVQGMASGGEGMRWSDLPWRSWVKPVSYWIPVVLFMWLALVGLAVPLHRQWADHEQVSYPIAAFTRSLLPGTGEAICPIFKNRSFLISTATVLAIHLVNFAASLNPELIRVKLDWDFYSLINKLPEEFRNNFNAFGALHTRIYFSVIGLAYFLSLEASLSLGLAPFLFGILAGIFGLYGISWRGGSLVSPVDFLTFGCLVGMFGWLIYTGRHYYARTLRSAVLVLKSAGVAATAEVWGMRIFIGGMTSLIVLLSVSGLDWRLALFLVFSMVMTSVVFARIIAETGLFFIGVMWTPSLILVGLVGPQAVGPEAVLLMGLFTVQLMFDPRESLMPFLVNGLRIVSLEKVEVGRAAFWCGGALIVGLGVALPLTFYLQYSGGSMNVSPWSMNVPAVIPWSHALQVKQYMASRGAFPDAAEVSVWEQMPFFQADEISWLHFLMGLGLMLLFTWMRVRFPRWPLHPILLIVWSSWALRRFALSFLLGWVLKIFVRSYFGEHAYRKFRPIAVGLIVGEILGAMIPLLINWLVYLHTGDSMTGYRIFPG